MSADSPRPAHKLPGAGCPSPELAAEPHAADWQKTRPSVPQDLARVVLHDDDRITVATVSGEIDMSSVAQVATALTGLSNLAIGLVVDLRSVDYLDSSGVSLLHDLAFRLRRRTQMLTIVCPPGSPPRRMLELTAVDTQAVVLDDLPDALAAIRAAYEDRPPLSP